MKKPKLRILAMLAAMPVVMISTAAMPVMAEKAINKSIDLSWALEQAQQYHPRLQAYPFYVRSLEGQKSQAALRPNPSLELSVENALGSGPYSAVDSAESTLVLSQTIELGGKRSQRLALADSRIAQQQAKYQLARLDVLAETGRRYYQLLYTQALQSWIARRSQQEAKALKVVRQRARAGSVLQADVSKMALRLAQSKAQSEQLQAQQQIARARLAAMWLDKGSFQLAEGSFETLPLLPSEAQLQQSLQQSPRLAMAEAAEQLANAQLQLARANGRSDITLGLGLRRFEANNEQALVFSASMPLAWQNPQRGTIQAAKANTELSQQQRAWAKAQLELQASQSLLQLQGLKAQSQRLQQDLLPKARKHLQDTERGYQRGTVSVLQWAEAQADLFSLQRQLIETHSQLFSQLLELESLTGQALAGSAAAK